MLYKDILYLDNTSTTIIDPEILSTYNKINSIYFANSSSIHRLGIQVKKLEDKSRKQIMDLLNISNYHLIFTSGATEANNIAIKSIALKYKHLGNHLITTEIEHPSVYDSFKFLQEYMGFDVTYLKVDKAGCIDLKELKDSLREDTILVSIMAVNNEIGTIINTTDWCEIVKSSSSAITHVDMVQALGAIDLDFNNVDLASFSAHKIHGVKGSGFLLMRKHLEMVPLISGGPQQFGFRAGTSNTPANIVLAKTVRKALESQQSNLKILRQLSKYVYKELNEIPNITLNSVLNKSVDSIINFSIIGIDSEVALNALSKKNIFVSAGSTCQSDLYTDSRVLKAIGKDNQTQRSRVRVSLDASLSLDDMKYFIKTVKEIIDQYAL